MREYSQRRLQQVLDEGRAQYAICKPPAADWKPPRRNGQYLALHGVTRSISEWARLAGIQVHTLIVARQRHGNTRVAQMIRKGLKGEYDPQWYGKHRRRAP